MDAVLDIGRPDSLFNTKTEDIYYGGMGLAYGKHQHESIEF